MTETTEWDSLRQLRMAGKKPALPVIVTSNERLPQRLQGVGAMVIFHEPGQSMPIKLLDGLDVIFMLSRCELGSSVKALADSKGVKLERMRVWCRCYQNLTVCALSCESHRAAVEYFERPRAT